MSVHSKYLLYEISCIINSVRHIKKPDLLEVPGNFYHILSLYFYFYKNPLKRGREEEAFFSSFFRSLPFLFLDSSLPLFLPFPFFSPYLFPFKFHFPFPLWYNISISKKGMKDACARGDLN